jgi:hypothetical protein|nr:MAG TPA: transmembrane cytochrome C oxidase subunit [Caudoviricetes sp.]
MNSERGLVLTALLTAALAVGLSACSAADVASSNISQDSDNFRVHRRVVFVNGITDEYLLEIEGLCSIKDSADDNSKGQLEVTCKVGDDQYKKHFLGLSDNVTYVVEQLEPSTEDVYHYKVVFRPETILPDISVE